MKKPIPAYEDTHMNMHWPKVLSVAIGFVIALHSVGLAQVTTGIPPFQSFGGGPDVINLGNLNVHYSMPVFSRAGRGTPFTYALAYDSSIWRPSGSTWVQSSSTWGLTKDVQSVVGVMYYSVSQVPCNGSICNLYAFGRYLDSAGTSHGFIALVSDNPDGGFGFSKTRVLDDGSGMTVTVDATPSAAVTLRSGEQIKPPLSTTPSPNGTVTDSNGNQITSAVNGSTTTFTDTLGTTALTISGTAPNPVSYKYTAPSGAVAPVTVSYKAYTVQTKFQCTGINEYGPLSNSLVDKITLPDGSYYQLSYEITPQDTHSPHYVTG